MKKVFEKNVIFILDLKINLEIEKKFVNIQKLLNLFQKKRRKTKLKGNKLKSKLKIIIKKANKRFAKISKNKKVLTITGNNIDDLSNPFNLIGVLQALFRFIGLHSIKNNFFLLHGSAAIFNNKAVCFADDGLSTGKTLSSVETASTSKKYIGDEFCFLDQNGLISSYPFIPIHIRLDVANYFKKNSEINNSIKKSNKTKAGYFINPKDNFEIIKSKKLSAFIFVHFDKRKKPSFKKLNKYESRQAVSNCVLSHMVKLFNPRMDRMRFSEEKDLTKRVNYNKKTFDSIKTTLKLNGSIENIVKQTTCYRFYISSPKDIVKFLKKIEL